MPPGKLIRCENCNERKPAKDFPPSPMSPAGYAPEVHGLRQAGRTSAAARKRRHSASPSPRRRPLPPHLVQAAVRFVAEYQPGVERPIDGEIEPEFRNLLLWVRYLSLKEAIAPMTPEEIGREILNCRDDRMARGVSFGALWAALVRAAAIYSAQDASNKAGVRARGSTSCK